MAAVVADTSPLIALLQIGHLSILKSLFIEVQIPPAVALEPAPSLPERPSWLLVRELTEPIGSDILRASLGRGESETLGLAFEVRAELVILDDRPARRLAIGLGLPVVGTMGVLLRAKRTGIIPAVQPLVEQLLRAGFRLSPAIRERVLTDAGEQS
jgi:predicted nucleic acid-binding protein